MALLYDLQCSDVHDYQVLGKNIINIQFNKIVTSTQTSFRTRIAMQIAAELIASYLASQSYPTNLVDTSNYLATLEAYKKRLTEAASKLCIENHQNAGVPFRDWDEATSSFKKQNILSDPTLRAWLGDQSRLIPNGSCFTRPDPKCRFIFFWAQHSRAQLFITRDMLAQTLSYHQVMPQYLDLLLLFGQRNKPNELRYSCFREQTLLSNNPVSADPLGRSGCHYEMCYNFKAVDLTNQTDILRNREWSVRQAAIYHKFDVVSGNTLWIITKGSLDLKQRVQDVTGDSGRKEDRSFTDSSQALRSSLSIHLMLAHWAAESWRWYIQWIEEVADEETKGALYGTRDRDKARKQFTASDLQDVQAYEEKATDAATFLETNLQILNAIQDYYYSLQKSDCYNKTNIVDEATARFCKQLKNIAHDTGMQISRAQSLVQMIRARKELILQHMQAQTAENMEGLTTSTFFVGVSAQKEAIAMRIITVVTLIYLPATFVSTFFSTDIVKYQTDMNETAYSTLAMNRWLQVALPLSAVTLILAFGWYWWAQRRRQNQLQYEFIPV